MSNKSSKVFTTHLSPEEITIVETVLEETGQTPTRFVRTALLYYFQLTPHDIILSYPADSLEELWAKMMEEL